MTFNLEKIARVFGFESCTCQNEKNRVLARGNMKPSHKIHFHENLGALSPVSAKLGIECAIHFSGKFFLLLSKDLDGMFY